MLGLKQRLLAPDLVEAFVRDYVAELNAANRDRGQRQAILERERTRLDRQIRNTLELIKDGTGTRSMVVELRAMEDRQDQLKAEIEEAAEGEAVPALHPNLAQIYRAQVEELEAALTDPGTAATAMGALRSVVDAIVVHPGERRGEVRVDLRGDLAAFLYLADGGISVRSTPRVTGGGMRSLVAGTGFEPVTFRL